VGLKEISYASNYPDVITTMADTHLLADVDLQLLDTDNKKMVFFANVVNLLYCHCLLLYGLYQAETTAIEVPPTLVPLFSSIEDGSWLSHLNLFGSVGYRIGQLGVIRYVLFKWYVSVTISQVHMPVLYVYLPIFAL